MQHIKYAATPIQVSYTYSSDLEEAPAVSTSADAHRLLLDGYEISVLGLQEQFVVLYLNRANRVLGLYRASVGGMHGTVADIRLILSVALSIGASAIVLSHNHPSGNLMPSFQDGQLTKNIKEACRYMEIKMLDHLILHPDQQQYFSYADDGRLQTF